MGLRLIRSLVLKLKGNRSSGDPFNTHSAEAPGGDPGVVSSALTAPLRNLCDGRGPRTAAQRQRTRRSPWRGRWPRMHNFLHVHVLLLAPGPTSSTESFLGPPPGAQWPATARPKPSSRQRSAPAQHERLLAQDAELDGKAQSQAKEAADLTGRAAQMERKEQEPQAQIR